MRSWLRAMKPLSVLPRQLSVGGRSVLFTDKSLEKVNPDFYPQPSKQIVDDKTGRVVRLEKIKEEYLTKELFIQLYDKCSEHLHSYNPYGEYPNLDELKADFLKCKDKIVNLLNHHQIQLVNRKKQLWVVMSTKDDGKVHVGEMVQTDL
jgi:hypothetical protein